jgi:hypothetical protein
MEAVEAFVLPIVVCNSGFASICMSSRPNQNFDLYLKSLLNINQ